MIIETRDEQVDDLLRSSYLLIPRFQRPYSWVSENIEDFWSDVFIENDEGYFIGTFVVYKEGENLEIVDGQQRMTTCIILLSCIRDQLKQNALNDLADGVHGLIEKKDINNRIRFSLSTETSYPYLQQEIMSNLPSTANISAGPEEILIEQAKKVFLEKISSSIKNIRHNPRWNEERKKTEIQKSLIEARDRILKLRFIKIELENEDDAYQIFETLNTRGKDLSVSDLVKNFITRNLRTGNSEDDPAKLKWKTIVETIDGSEKNINTSGFIHHYWLSKYEYVTIKKLFKEIKQTITKNNVQNFLDELESDSATYRSIFDVGFSHWAIEHKELEGSLEAMNIFKVRQQVPMVLSVLRQFSAGNYSLKNASDIISSIEKFHFIFTAVTSQRSSGGISQMYAASAKNFANSNNQTLRRKYCLELKGKLKYKIPTYKQFEPFFAEIIYTKNVTKQNDLIKYILFKYNKSLNSSYAEDLSLLTIEHLASQNTTLKNIGQIGNLILINKKTNELLADKNFKQKKEILLANHIIIDNHIRKATSWTDKQIEKRTIEIAKIAYNKIWKI